MDKILVSPALPTLVKPTLDTPFHVDYGWWERKGLHLGVELSGHLCQKHRAVFSEHFDTEKMDWIDERTGEVTEQHRWSSCGEDSAHVGRTASVQGDPANTKRLAALEVGSLRRDHCRGVAIHPLWRCR
jgi:hypothetical protein